MNAPSIPTSLRAPLAQVYADVAEEDLSKLRNLLADNHLSASLDTLNDAITALHKARRMIVKGI